MPLRVHACFLAREQGGLTVAQSPRGTHKLKHAGTAVLGLPTRPATTRPAPAPEHLSRAFSRSARQVGSRAQPAPGSLRPCSMAEGARAAMRRMKKSCRGAASADMAAVKAMEAGSPPLE